MVNVRQRNRETYKFTSEGVAKINEALAKLTKNKPTWHGWLEGQAQNKKLVLSAETIKKMLGLTVGDKVQGGEEGVEENKIVTLRELLVAILEDKSYSNLAKKIKTLKRGDDWQLVTFESKIKSKPTKSNNENKRTTTQHQLLGRSKDYEILEKICGLHRIIVIRGGGGFGKSRLAESFIEMNDFEQVLEIHMPKDVQNFIDVESVLSHWIQELTGIEQRRDLQSNLVILRRIVREKKIGILIDNLETALDINGCFTQNYKRYLDLLRVLDDIFAKSKTIITSRVKLCEYSIECEDYLIQGLELQYWLEFFSITVNDSDLIPKEIIEMHSALGGSPFGMKILFKNIHSLFDGDFKEYWKQYPIRELLSVEKNLKNLVNEQFELLRIISPNAYKLLCRMGCYRYQEDVPSIPNSGLIALMWDIDENEHLDIIETLQNHCLIEYRTGEYYLHPFIREISVARLRNDFLEWQTTNNNAAEYFTKSVDEIKSIRDANRALESLYHYRNIGDYISMCQSLARDRNNPLQFKESSNVVLLRDSLGNSVLRYGLFEKMTFWENAIIEQLDLNTSSKHSQYEVAKFFNIFGDLYLPLGKIIKSAHYHIKSREVAIACSNRYLDLASLTNLALCKVELCQYDEAKTLLLEVISGKSDDWYNEHEDKFVVISSSILLYVLCCLGLYNDARILLPDVYDSFTTYKLGIQGMGYRYIFTAKACKCLGYIDKSFSIFESALKFSQAACYKILEGHSILGIAELERIQGDSKSSVVNHIKAINIFEQSGSNTYLADAYLQYALTLKEIDNEDYVNFFNKAIVIYQNMENVQMIKKTKSMI